MTPPPAAAAAARTAPAVHPRRAPLAPVRRPRRVSGPAPARRAASPATPAIAVSTHPLFDRLIHGRAWIGIVAFALIGIVTMQLGLLKLNAGIGRALEHEAALQRENSALSVENSEVAAGDTVELQAAHMGMQLIPAGALRFLSAPGSGGGVVIARAAAAAKAPMSGSSVTATGASESSAAETSATSASTASGESSTGSSTESATPAAATTSTAPAAESTTVSAASEGSTGVPAPTSASTPTTAPTGESGGASAGPQG